jgi:hypothetical protein
VPVDAEGIPPLQRRRLGGERDRDPPARLSPLRRSEWDANRRKTRRGSTRSGGAVDIAAGNARHHLQSDPISESKVSAIDHGENILSQCSSHRETLATHPGAEASGPRILPFWINKVNY